MDTLSCPPCHIPINLMVVILRRGDFYSLCSGASEGRRVLCSKQDICIFISLILTAVRVRKLRQARNRVVYWIARVTTKDFRTLISQFSSVPLVILTMQFYKSKAASFLVSHSLPTTLTIYSAFP